MLSLGLEVAIAERPAPSNADDSESRAWVERMARERDTDAVIDVIGDAARRRRRHLGLRTTAPPIRVSRVALEPDAENRRSGSPFAPSRCCVPRLVEIDLIAKGQRAPIVGQPPPATVAKVAPREPGNPTGASRPASGRRSAHELRRRRARADAARTVGWTAPRGSCWQGALAGFGSRATRDVGGRQRARRPAIRGSRRLYCVRGARALQPYVALSARRAAYGDRRRGGHAGKTRTSSSAGPSFWMAAWARGCVLPGRYHLTLAAHVQVAEPYVAIHFVDTLVATSGQSQPALEPDGRRVAVTSRRRAAPLALRGALAVLVAVAVVIAGCARADVYPITGAPDGAVGGVGGDGGPQSDRVSIARVAAGDTSRTVQVDSVSRSYVLHVPAAYDGKRPVPLVVDFHGIGASGASERASSPYPAQLDAEGVIMAFPDGLKGPPGPAGTSARAVWLTSTMWASRAPSWRRSERSRASISIASTPSAC